MIGAEGIKLSGEGRVVKLSNRNKISKYKNERVKMKR